MWKFSSINLMLIKCLKKHNVAIQIAKNGDAQIIFNSLNQCKTKEHFKFLLYPSTFDVAWGIT